MVKDAAEDIWGIYVILTAAAKKSALNPAPQGPATQVCVQPRTQGALVLSTKAVEGRSAIDRFRTSGAMKALFPRVSDGQDLQAILINTSGGLTGGDRIDVSAEAGENSQLTLTTQAAERAYRASSGVARVTSQLSVRSNAQLNWLPQEMILFNGSALSRDLTADLAPDARLLMVEPVIFGRVAMGETLTSVQFRDRISVNRAGTLLYWDGMDLNGDAVAHLARPALGRGAGAMASALYVAPDAEAHLDQIRATLPETGGASLLAPDVMAIRLLAPDSFELRRSLIPILERLSKDRLPTSWRL